VGEYKKPYGTLIRAFTGDNKHSKVAAQSAIGSLMNLTRQIGVTYVLTLFGKLSNAPFQLSG